MGKNQAKEDVTKYSLYMRMDYERKNKNIDDRKSLCKKCDGTGNQLFSYYQKCTKCDGLGFKELLTK